MIKLDFGSSVRLVAVIVVAVCLAVGCRRTDVRDFEVSIPKMTAESEPAIRQALAGFAGVEKPSLKFDQKAKKLTAGTSSSSSTTHFSTRLNAHFCEMNSEGSQP